jgi:2-iminobutanoate/2-iminopropanoate deaminase
VQAVESDGLLFLSGQLGIDPRTGELVPGGAASQAEAVLRNICAVLEAAGAGLEDVVKVSVFLRDISDFPEVNEVYGRHFSSWRPARTTIGGLQLPKDALVEIDAVARVR